jgi:hypothetical protein
MWICIARLSTNVFDKPDPIDGRVRMSIEFSEETNCPEEIRFITK